MRTTKNASPDPYCVLQRRHGLAEIVERGAVGSTEHLRVKFPHPERDIMNKHVPLPKMMVPVGKVEGKPVALQFMGRAGPAGTSDLAYAFDDELLRGLDVPFLRDVDTLVDAMVAVDPSLARVAPEMVTRDLAA